MKINFLISVFMTCLLTGCGEAADRLIKTPAPPRPTGRKDHVEFTN